MNVNIHTIYRMLHRVIIFVNYSVIAKFNRSNILSFLTSLFILPMTQIEQINLIWKRAPESAGHNKFYLVQLKDKPIIKDYADLPILATAQIREHMIVNSEWFREFDAELYVSLNIENSEWMSSLKEHEALSWVHRRINTFMAQWYNIEPLFCIEEVLKIDSYELCEAFDKERCRQRRRALSYNHTTNKWNELEKDKYE